MASVNLFSLLASPGNKGVNVLALDAEFDTGVAAVTNLAAGKNLISTTLDAASGTPVGYKAIGFNILAGHTLNTGSGDDSLSVLQGSALNAIGINIGTGSTLNLGDGKNKVIILLTGAGSLGVNNQSKFLAGIGGDTIKADAGFHGLINGSATNTTALFNMGAGGDTASFSGVTGNGIENWGTITMGLDTEADKDVLTGSSAGHPLVLPAPFYDPNKFGIFNKGTINFGGGKDVVDALLGGFGGGGTYNLGWTKTVAGKTTQDTDVDVVNGFGAGTFNGGGGRNAITLPAGDYTINYNTATGHKPISLTDLASGALTKTGSTAVMTFNSFDGIGGFGLDPLLAGVHFFNAPPVGAGTVLNTFSVNALGNVSAATYVA
jgi:hypothetical protein